MIIYMIHRSQIIKSLKLVENLENILKLHILKTNKEFFTTGQTIRHFP